MNKMPLIDGIRDDFIPVSDLRDFKDIYWNGKSYGKSGVSYYLGYTFHGLYIYIEAEADSITGRDRAYQNGDGFHLTLGMAKDDNSDTDEFYVLGFSPSDDWTRKIQWYYNVDLRMKRLGEDVLFETHADNGTAGFELLLPWNVVYPYHPLMYENIGFNLCFVKAVNELDKIYHFITTDGRMQSEQSKRKYVKLKFGEPLNQYGFYARPVRNNFTTGDSLEIILAGYALQKTRKNFQVKVTSENNAVHSESIDVEMEKGFSSTKHKLRYSIPFPGTYMIKVFDDHDVAGQSRISVFEYFDSSKLHSLLDASRTWISEGTYNSLRFYIDDLENERKELKDYEASPSVSSKITELNRIKESLKKQVDPLASKVGLYRRAFLSGIDHTLRPYSVYVPEEYDPQKEYPLLIYLHGSGQDDRALFTTNYIKEGFIILAPNGRGTSNCFATVEALTDIREAITDVQENYNINSDKIVLSGFSMGGYGVYRTFYEFPELFHAIAVLSGHPNLAGKWGSPNPVDFLDTDKFSVFADVPSFIYHGEQDQNCPFNIMYDFVSQLKECNSKVLFVTDKEAGHGSMNQKIMEQYHDWLLKVSAE